jgi:hypothetical protein
VNRWAATLAGCAAQAVRTREAGWAALKIRPNSRIQIRKHFSFSKPFYKLQINLNSNQI